MAEICVKQNNLNVRDALHRLNWNGVRIYRNIQNNVSFFKSGKGFSHLLGDMVSTIGTRKNLSNYNRQQKNPLTEIREGDLYICLEHRLVMIREQEITLTVKEFDILALLIMNPKWVFTKEQIYQHVYGDVEIEVDNRVYGLIKNLRKKIEENPETPHYIETIRGVGYRFRT